MKVYIIAVAMLFLCSCSPYTVYVPPKQRNIEKSLFLRKGYDEVWQKLVTWFSEHNSPIKTIDKASGLITTERNLNVNDTVYCDCGTPRAYDYVVKSTGNINITVKSINKDSTYVTVNAFYKCNFASATDHPGKSTGVLESEIFTALQK